VSLRSRAAQIALAAAALGGCATSNWLEEKKLAPIVFPRTILPIMVFRSDTILVDDREGLTDAIASALCSELGRYGIQTTVVELAGSARSPRIELAVYSFEESSTSGFPVITVDCAYVSPGEQIAYVGRLQSVGSDQSMTSGVEPLARAIAEKFTSLA